MDLNTSKIIEADEETLHYAEEDRENPEQKEVSMNMESGLTFLLQTRQSDRAKPTKKYIPCGDVSVVDRIDLKKIVEDLVGLNNRVTGCRH